MRTKAAVINSRTFQRDLICGLISIFAALFVLCLVRAAGGASLDSINEFESTYGCGMYHYCDLSDYEGFRGKSTQPPTWSAEDCPRIFGFGGCPEIGAFTSVFAKGKNLFPGPLTPPNLARADFSDATLEKLDVAPGADASGIKFVRANIKSRALLKKINLTGADFTGVRMRRASFGESDLRGARFRNATFVLSVEFVNADLRETDFTGATIEGEYNEVIGRVFGKKASRVANINFFNADLTDAIWISGQKCGPGSIGKCVTDKGEISLQTLDPEYGKDDTAKPRKTGKKAKRK